MSAARDYLDRLAMHGIKLGLDNIQRLLEATGNPQNTYPTVHIAGTNGKGSVVALAHAMFQQAGYRVGRFTSPHLIDLRERFQINGVCISEEALEENIACFREIAQDFEYPPTFFELNTAIAFRWFAQQQVDLALIETGMGGRLDSTNVLHPLACAITNIGLEHTQYLGDTLEAIASEKAGIIKPHTPVVVGERQPGPRAVIEAAAHKLQAPCTFLGEHFDYNLSGPIWDQRLSYTSATLQLDPTPLGLAGRHQGENAAVAIALAEQCRARFPRLNEGAMRAGLALARWPARLERVLEDPPVIIDAAHNAAGARIIAQSLGPCVVLLALASDKDAPGILEALAPIARPLILTQFSGERALPAAALAAAAKHMPHELYPDLAEALQRGLACAAPDCPLLITGSLYLAGEARQLLIRRHGAPPLEF